MDIKEELEKYVPYNEQEEKDKELMLKAINSFDDVLTRENIFGHFTASSWIVNKERTKILMIYHNIYKAWSWTGGHADGDSDLKHVALKEATEETGIEHFKILNDGIFSIEAATVDGHVKKGKHVASHIHYNVSYLLEADEKDAIKIKEDENSGIKWVDINDVTAICDERKMKVIYQKLNEKLAKLENLDTVHASGGI